MRVVTCARRHAAPGRADRERSCLPASPSPVPVPARRAARRGRPAGHCHGTPPTAAQAWQTPPLKQAAPFSKAPCVSAVACSLSQRPNPSIHLSIHHPRPPSVSSNVNPRTRPVALVPSSPHPAKQKSMDHGVLPLPYPTLPSLLFLLASHRHRDAKGRAGHAAAPWHTTRRER